MKNLLLFLPFLVSCASPVQKTKSCPITESKTPEAQSLERLGLSTRDDLAKYGAFWHDKYEKLVLEKSYAINNASLHEWADARLNIYLRAHGFDVEDNICDYQDRIDEIFNNTKEHDAQNAVGIICNGAEW